VTAGSGKREAGSGTQRRRPRSVKWGDSVFGGALVLLMIFTLFPWYWAIVASFTPDAALFRDPSLIPTHLIFDHYRALFTERDFITPIRNSLVVAGTTTLFCLVVGTLAAYALARIEFRGKAPIMAFILAVTMFPQISIVSPLYLLLRSLHLIDTYPGLIMPYMTFAMPLTVWVLTGSIRQIPKDLEEAAHVDGASRLQSFLKILLPLAVPSLATTGILTFIYCWNEFLFALSFTLGPERQTVPVAIALFRGQYQVPWGEILAAAVVATAPVAALVLVFQRRIVQGLTAGAVKG
jgi:ABC-type glycerol-3-phosphate transport system permease component